MDRFYFLGELRSFAVAMIRGEELYDVQEEIDEADSIDVRWISCDCRELE